MSTSTWLSEADQGWIFLAGFLVTAFLVRWTWKNCFPVWPISPPPTTTAGAAAPPPTTTAPAAASADAWQLKLVEWERDRVMAVAKGIAATAAGFLSAVLTALLQNNITNEVPPIAIIGCLLGVAGSLLLAGELAKSTRSYVPSPP